MKDTEIRTAFEEIKDLIGLLREQQKEQHAATALSVKSLEGRVFELEKRPTVPGPVHRTISVTLDGDRPIRGVRVIYADEEDSK